MNRLKKEVQKISLPRSLVYRPDQEVHELRLGWTISDPRCKMAIIHEAIEQIDAACEYIKEREID